MSIDKDKVQELILFAESNRYSMQHLENEYRKNLQLKKKRGVYDHVKAIKLLEYFYSNYVRPEAIRNKDLGYDPKLNPAERKIFAEHFVDLLENEYLQEKNKFFKEMGKTKKKKSGSSTVKQISSRAKIIYRNNPQKKWTDCIKIAAQELNAENPVKAMKRKSSFERINDSRRKKTKAKFSEKPAHKKTSLNECSEYKKYNILLIKAIILNVYRQMKSKNGKGVVDIGNNTLYFEKPEISDIYYFIKK